MGRYVLSGVRLSALTRAGKTGAQVLCLDIDIEAVMLAEKVTRFFGLERLVQFSHQSVHHLERYPRQLSGGQRQRVAIACGLSLQPRLLICDEPTSSLDVSIQAQILNLLKELKNEFNMSYLFISHDIAAIRFMSDRIAVLKNGILVDLFASEAIFADSRHSYMRQIVDAII